MGWRCAALWLFVVGGCGRSDADLRGDTRTVGEVGAVRAVARLEGRYERERHLGGRLGFSTPTETEDWTLSYALEGDARVLLATTRGSVPVWRGASRSEGATKLAELGWTTCSAGDVQVFRVGERPWLAAFGGTVPFVVALTSEAQACGDVVAPSADVALRDVWEDGLDAYEVFSAPDEEASARHAAGERACEVLIERGDAREGLRCSLALGRGLLPNDEITRRIRAGAEARPDVEAALFALAAAPLPPPSDARLEARLVRHSARAFPGHLMWTTTPSRQRELVEAIATRGDASWQLEAASRLAARLGEAALCDRLVARFATLGSSDSTSDETVRGAFRATPELLACASEDVMRSWMLVGLARPTLAADVFPTECEATYVTLSGLRESLCRSLPHYAGSWLAAHCHPDAVARAEALVAARESVPGRDAVREGAERVLGSCRPPD